LESRLSQSRVGDLVQSSLSLLACFSSPVFKIRLRQDPTRDNMLLGRVGPVLGALELPGRALTFPGTAQPVPGHSGGGPGSILAPGTDVAVPRTLKKLGSMTYSKIRLPLRARG
jgi:hypothetical protein